MTREECFERGCRYSQEAMKANVYSFALADPVLPRVDYASYPTVVMPREVVARFSQQYFTLLALCSELLDVRPEQLTEGHAFFAMMKRYAPVREDADENI